MSLIRVTAPTAEPVTLDEAKQHLRVLGNDDDAYIIRLITAARHVVETNTARALITQTWDWKFGSFPCDGLNVPLAPLVSVTSISYVDIAGATVVWPAAQYAVLDAGAVTATGRIVPAYGESWPSVRGLPNDIIVLFVAGYGDAATVPDEIRWAMLLIIGELYERREDALAGAVINTVPISAEYLLRPYRSVSF